MRDFNRCDTCGKYDFMDSHVCPPAWRVWEPDQGQTEYDGDRLVYARDAEKAAEKWASRDDWDESEARIAMGRSEPEVCVIRVGGDEIQRFKVRGEMVPEYRAEPLKGKARGEQEEESEEEEDQDEAQSGA